MYHTPSAPSTLAISCGSETVATVPCTTASRANSVGTSIELSIWTWASVKPGSRYRSAWLLVADIVKLVNPASADDEACVIDALREHIDDVAGDLERGGFHRLPTVGIVTAADWWNAPGLAALDPADSTVFLPAAATGGYHKR